MEIELGYDFNIYEERILKTMQLAFRELTTRQIAMFSGISYNTVKNYLNQLKKKEVIDKQRKGNRIFWSIERGETNVS